MFGRAATRQSGEKYYEYLLTYVDNILTLTLPFKQLTEIYHFKKYLEADVIEFYFPNDPNKKRQWGMSSEQYVKEAIRMVKLELSKSELNIAKKMYRILC